MFKKEVVEVIARYRILISKIIAIFLILIFLFSEHSWANKSYSGLLNLVLQSAGLIFITVAVLGRLWAALYLCGNKTHTLVTYGPYSMVRNPLYFFSFIGVIGVGLTSGSLVGLLLLIFIFLFYYFPTIIDEEKTLERFHKEDLEAYMDKVPRLIPNFSILEEPETYTIQPHYFKRTFFDVVWFYWVYLILVIIERLHTFHILPSVFKII